MMYQQSASEALPGLVTASVDSPIVNIFDNRIQL
jgi:hypothetical protein